MVAHDPRRPSDRSRGFTPDTERALREVISERWRALESSEDRLRSVVDSAAREARDQGLRPEEVIVAIKSLEGDVFGHPAAMRANDPAARERFRGWLVSTCIAAYFAKEAEPGGG